MSATAVSTAGLPGFETVLGPVPATLQGELLRALNEVVKNYRERRWEPSELNGGKLCEVVYTILRGHVDGRFPARATKPRNMIVDCQALERAAGFPRSVRIQIPRMLIALYEIRSNRGVSHVGGDVDPNHMDATAVLGMSKWVVAELVRLFHNMSPAAATLVVEALISRETPLVWEVGNNKRVLRPGMKKKDKMLLLLHQTAAPVALADLARWLEQENLAWFRRDVVWPAHEAKLIDFDPGTGLVHLSPTGVEYVERRVLN